MTEHEYEEWFDKYLGNVESLSKQGIEKSPLSCVPKPLNRMRWICISSIGLILCGGVSCLLAWLYEVFNHWLLNWCSNALLNFCIGIIASLFIMIYTNAKEKNIASYSDIIPILEDRHKNMEKAYFDYAIKIKRYFQSRNYEKCYFAWHATCNSCCVILLFIEYLNSVLPFTHPKLTFSSDEIEKLLANLTEANNLIQKEFFSDGRITNETIDLCTKAANSGMEGLYVIRDIIQELKHNLYGIKYGRVAERIKGIGEDNDDL